MACRICNQPSVDIMGQKAQYGSCALHQEAMERAPKIRAFVTYCNEHDIPIKIMPQYIEMTILDNASILHPRANRRFVFGPARLRITNSSNTSLLIGRGPDGCHPHGHNPGAICLGSWDSAIYTAVKIPNPQEAILLARMAACMFNPWDGFATALHSVTCRHCQSRHDSMLMSRCPLCGEWICYKCSRYRYQHSLEFPPEEQECRSCVPRCTRCNQKIEKGQEMTCNRCGRILCPDHAHTCASCGKTLCGQCSSGIRCTKCMGLFYVCRSPYSGPCYKPNFVCERCKRIEDERVEDEKEQTAAVVGSPGDASESTDQPDQEELVAEQNNESSRDEETPVPF